MAVAGRSFSFNDFGMKHARQQRWRLGIQREIDIHTVIEAAYVGAYSDRVYVTQTLDPLPAQYWNSGLVRNNAIASNLNSNVPNPFRLSNFADLQGSSPLLYQNMSTLPLFTSSTIKKNQLLRRFPQMSSLTNSSSNLGKARSASLEINLQRRFSNGFNLNVAYTRLDAHQADIFYNEFDPLPIWRSTNYGMPHRFTAMSVVELPFGKGHPFLRSGILSQVLGGFRLGVTYEFQPGPLLDFSNLFYYGNLEDIALSSGQRTFNRWFNTDNFERNAANAPAAFQARVFPTRVENVRGDILNYWSMNAGRDFRFTERLRLQVRLDAMNALNRSVFSLPNTNPLSTSFGQITSTTAQPSRYIFIQGRIQF
jgi:hypothetical protein